MADKLVTGLEDVVATPDPADGDSIVWSSSVENGAGGWVTRSEFVAGFLPAVVTAATTATDGQVIRANGTFTVTITQAANAYVIVKNVGSGTITVALSSGTIDGNANITLAANAIARILCDGTNGITI